MARKKLFLIDSFGFIFRAYHARARNAAPPMRTSTGLSTEAVYIFNNMLRKLGKAYSPEYVAAVFESGAPTHRMAEFAEYKANRAEAPPDLAEQLPFVRRILEAMRIPILEYSGFEADDVIGTIARRAEAAGLDVVIVSSDKDMMQLITDRVTMLDPAKEDLVYDPAKVKEFLGVAPAQVADLFALKGDAIDNIPGAPGIGDKGARDLVEKFGSVEAALERAAEVERKMYRESLQNNVDRIRMSKRLATIETAVPIDFALENVVARDADLDALKAVYKELEFHSLLRELGPSLDNRARDYLTLDSGSAVADYLASIPGDAAVAVALSVGGAELGLFDQQAAEGAEKRGQTPFPTPGKGVSPLFSAPSAACAGISWRAGEARVAPLAAIRGFLEDSSRSKIVCDVKTAVLSLWQLGISARGFSHDILLYAFLLDADPSGCSLEQQAQRRLDIKLSGAPEQRADLTLEMWAHLDPAVTERGLRKLYDTIDLPLASVLARMERTGVLIDAGELGRLSSLMEGEIARLTSEIHALAGKPFNISSPQQLGKILFQDLGLPAPVKYGKGKVISTAADVLDELAPKHEIVRKVLEYRQLTKLKGTYVDALPSLIDPRTGRLHTSFNQAGAATGRLSSSNPNLQNIPIKTELGREIRAAFVPRPGWKMMVADYSQIELRLLAHMSHDPVLVDAFRRGEDIHTRTAAEVMGVPPLMVTPEARRQAKVINFGIVYGMSPFGLSQTLGISRQEAEEYIDNYFVRYAGVKRFIDDTIVEVRRTGVARTLFDRERPIPDMNSRNPNSRGFAERTAVNTPLQGTAADLIKLAMIRIDAALDAGGFESAMLLQVHDELVFEAPPGEVDAVRALVKREMEQAYPLEVPLVVEIGVGDNWRDAK